MWTLDGGAQSCRRTRTQRLHPDRPLRVPLTAGPLTPGDDHLDEPVGSSAGLAEHILDLRCRCKDTTKGKMVRYV